jgi:quercetin dioxygenase-like cupin family protein
MHEGTEIESHQLNDSVTFQMIEGTLEFHTRKETVILNEGQLMTFTENVKYHLKTRKETVFLLIISNSITLATNN